MQAPTDDLLSISADGKDIVRRHEAVRTRRAAEKTDAEKRNRKRSVARAIFRQKFFEPPLQ